MVRVVFTHLKSLDPATAVPTIEPAAAAPGEQTATTDHEAVPAIAPMDPAGMTLGGIEPDTPKGENPPDLNDQGEPTS